MAKSILITGGCGFIGSNLAVELKKEGYAVTCFDNLSRRGSEILMTRIQESGCAFVHGDIRNRSDLDRLSEHYDVMLECSAEPSVLTGANGQDAEFMVENNLIGALNCFEFARKRDCAVVFLSTSRIYPYDYIANCRFEETQTRYEYADTRDGISTEGVTVSCPLEGARSIYGATKLSAEIILSEYSRSYGLPAIINRCGVIAGPWQLGKVDQGVFTFWLTQHYFKKRLKYIGFNGTGKQVRDLLHVHDLYRLISKQVRTIEEYRGTTFNVGGGIQTSLSLQETTEICERLTGNKLAITGDPSGRPADLCWYVTDNGSTCSKFKWKPSISAEEIISDIYKWLRQQEVQFRRIFNA